MPAERLIERDTELTRLRATVAAAGAGEGGGVLLDGRAGLGKSALLAEAAAFGRDGGLRVLRARGAELEGEFAFGLVRQLLEPVLAGAAPPERRELLQGPALAAAAMLGLPGARAAGGSAGLDGALPAPGFPLLHGLYWLCANLAARHPLVLSVDDLHWGDLPSLRFLAFLAGRLDELPVALLAASRPASSAATGDLLAELAGEPAMAVLRLRPLTADGLAALVEERLGEPPDPAFVAACLETTGGAPFLVRELLGALASDGTTPGAASAERVRRAGSDAVRRWMLVRLGALPPAAARLAAAVAVFEEADLRLAAELAGLGFDEAAHAADALVDADVLAPGRPLRFVHPLVRAAVYADLLHGRRGQAHRRAALALADAGAGPERVVEHLLVAEPAGDPWAVERLAAAARVAAARGAPESAVRLLRRVLDEPPAAEERPGLLLELGDAQRAAGDPGAEATLERASSLAGDARVRVGAALGLAQLFGRQERYGRAVDVLDRARRAVAGDDAAGAAALDVLLISTAVLGVETRADHAPRIAALRAAADAPGADRDELAIAAFIAVMSGEPAATAAALARRARAAGDDPLPGASDGPWFSYVTIVLLWTEQHEEALAALDAAAARGRRTADLTRLVPALAHRAWLHLRCGDLTGAEGDAGQVLELPAPDLYRGLAAGVLAEVRLERGDVAGAEGALAGAAAVVERASATAATARLVRARVRLAQGRPADAEADVLAAGDIAAALAAPCPSFLPWRSEAAGLLAARGDAEGARELAAEEVELARAFGAPRTLGMALTAAGAVARDPGLLREAIAVLRDAGAPLELARARLALGTTRDGTGLEERREALRLALDHAHRAGAGALADRAEAALRATGARPRRVVLTGVAALTAGEREVAQLAADGLTNREIAQALFLTARTVEGKLTVVFRKLGVGARSDLAAALHEERQTPAPAAAPP